MKGKPEEIYNLYKIVTLYFTNKLKGFVCVWGGGNKNQIKKYHLIWLILIKVYKNIFKITATCT